MNRILLLWLSVLSLVSYSCVGQNAKTAPISNHQSEMKDSTRLLKEIRLEYQRINSATLTPQNYTWETDTTCDAPPMAGLVTYFREGNQLVKILNDGAEDHGEWKEEYYFKAGKLFFVFQHNTYGGAANPTEFKYESRYYFNDGLLIKKIESSEQAKTDEEGIDRLVKEAYLLYKAKGSQEISRIFSCN
ncbi:hypothetical protein [Taibaiella sp. KBW10]|uniref:hypothetical protein n=1 Tax=Taibaiella sp. KBW10 TaxID=2153357 RepID=UPI000F5AE012|nr:hypothetical protein [Taibaiella sp. KBW10]